MVSVFRKPIGFAFLLFLLDLLITHLLMFLGPSIAPDSPIWYIVFLAPIALGILFTYLYVKLVDAHLSQGFRIRATIFTVLLFTLFTLGFAFVWNPIAFAALIRSSTYWLQTLMSLVIKYITITLGNWLGSFSIKTKGHI